MALVKYNAALLINDRSAEDTLVAEALLLLKDEARMRKLSENIGKMALPDADDLIALEVLDLAERGQRK
jgi:UDP-N-acetylglucosamine--N-acetylmuramyl-(pentapeptide) pyrophosphoryl-undecaprenol N-acetylglucosamine transferase